MQGNGLTVKDKKLMVKYGFMPDDKCVPSSSNVFAYRTFMSMKGNYMENGAKAKKEKNEFKSKRMSWPYAV